MQEKECLNEVLLSFLAVSLHQEIFQVFDEDAFLFLFQFRLYLRVEGIVDRVDMFEIEVVENIPLTKVSGRVLLRKLSPSGPK